MKSPGQVQVGIAPREEGLSCSSLVQDTQECSLDRHLGGADREEDEEEDSGPTCIPYPQGRFSLQGDFMELLSHLGPLSEVSPAEAWLILH